MKSMCRIFSMLLFGFLFSTAAAQQSNTFKVAIFVYDGVELLDFGGPGEVFAATRGFETFTVAVSADPILSQGFVRVTPEYSISNCPKPDIVVLPGGGTRQVRENESVINWIRSIADNDGIMLSVCTGAFILSKAGLLDGKKATTWYGAIDGLQEATPNATILKETRFVDNGRVITTAGVSAGIDGALHVVSKLKGMEEAKKTAQYMEYDKWDPTAGLIIESDLINQIRNNGVQRAIKLNAIPNPATNYHLFYEGEMLNLGNEYLAQNRLDEAVKIFELNLEAYPNSSSSNLALARAYEGLGKTDVAKKFYRDYLQQNQSDLMVVDKMGFDETMKLFEVLDQNNKLNESNINVLGYRLLQAERIADAIKIFALNVNAFPESWNAYDSLAEAYMVNGENQQAIKFYQKSLEKNPDNENAKEYLTKLKNQYN